MTEAAEGTYPPTEWCSGAVKSSGELYLRGMHSVGLYMLYLESFDVEGSAGLRALQKTSLSRWLLVDVVIRTLSKSEARDVLSRPVNDQ